MQPTVRVRLLANYPFPWCWDAEDATGRRVESSWEEIGQATGTIWRQLADRHAATTLGKLKQATKLSDQLLLMGLGWLAREGKVALTRHPRSLEVSLRESQTA